MRKPTGNNETSGRAVSWGSYKKQLKKHGKRMANKGTRFLKKREIEELLKKPVMEDRPMPPDS